MTTLEQSSEKAAGAVSVIAAQNGGVLLGPGTHTGNFAMVVVARSGTTITGMTAEPEQGVTGSPLTFGGYFNPQSLALEPQDTFTPPQGYRITQVVVGAGGIQVAHR